MARRVVRPWDRKGIAGRFQDDTSSSRSSVVHVDGLEYQSDRFYLLRPMGEPSSASSGCTCGARGPPPLLDRSRLVASLKLKAAILATFTLDPSAMSEEFPSLFGPSATVPTLVLHGHKGLQGTVSSNKADEASLRRPLAKRARVGRDAGNIICIDDSSDEEDSPEETNAASGTTTVPVKEEEPPEEAWLRMDASSLTSIAFGSTVHLTEVLTTWLPPNAKRESISKPSAHKCAKEVIVLDSDEETIEKPSQGCGVDASVVHQRILKRGVHHPKFMILFETSGSVIVVVSTSNLTQQRSVDAAWLQRFGPSTASATSKDSVTDDMGRDGSDFGHVLTNYLECQSNAAREGHMIPEDFLKRYLDIATLSDFRRKYRFEESKVHLIATVPGEYGGRQSATHLGRNGRTFLYGSQRVADILSRISRPSSAPTRSGPWLPPAILSGDDRLILQPTSFGGNFTRQNMTELGRLYFGGGHNDEGTKKSTTSDELLDKIDILWPTQDFMEEIHRSHNLNRMPSPDSVAVGSQTTEAIKKQREAPAGFVFLSSKTFNTIDLACISRMAMYECSVPQQLTMKRTPHFKSYARLFEGNDFLLRQNYGASKSEELFSWFMLTSACLSRGAQGAAALQSSLGSPDQLVYSNFELGVLFASRLTGNSTTDRLYCWRPGKCLCNQSPRFSASVRVEMIHLPIPYCIRPQSYQSDPDEAEMCATPFFHEIQEGTGSVGQMQLTPLGAKLASTRK